ncbi:DNA-binding response regulator [Betaproteobacteria bacterium]|nr:DNA-binding response regulator [Betaproteobacteria bacterium]GHT97551.1 DNA-binding response regulator [Betaproteobacteria bacterium]GHT97986.1 DNA-binding response regulator [Betaproteobacteria bacterium]GHU11860.1 DNA-binding response regulator [Betaproteobacteria bacterium]GHU18725.1 DNA-binding response regulator [Betaproteobacteria bacterium]
MNAALSLKLRVLVVEDQSDIAELILVNLRHNGFDVVAATDGESAQRELDARLPDVILLDWMLPGGQSGLDLVRKWRAAAHTRDVLIIMLTARSEEADKLAGLDGGVDDYITKPFSTKELIARIRTVLRRRVPEQLAEKLQVGRLSLDVEQLRVRYDDEELKLGPTELRMLHCLMKHPERIYSRAQLLDEVWGHRTMIEERTVDVHIKRLRDALKKAGTMIETVRSAGYRLVSMPED